MSTGTRQRVGGSGAWIDCVWLHESGPANVAGLDDAGVCVLTGFYTPLALILCMPISFCVFYWDTPLEGWMSTAASYGWSVLLCNVILCLAYVGSYQAMFALRSKPRWFGGGAAMRQPLFFGRLVFGAWMVASAGNYWLFSFWPLPIGHEPLAIQLMAALTHSGLFGVAMAIQLVTGALILAGLFVPVSLCVVMPITTCALYWSVILDHQPLGMMLALAAFALNGVLMLAYLEYYRGTLQRRAHGARAVRRRVGLADGRRCVLRVFDAGPHRPLVPAHPRLPCRPAAGQAPA